MKEFLSRMGIVYEERNISRDRQAKEEYLEKGYDLLPAIEIGNSIIIEYTGEPQLIEALAAEGYLS
ncbi:MAG: glutaredoxin domain-containing protein [Chloroflexia bacterium]